MVRRLLVVAACCAIAACGHKGSQRLEGHWRGYATDGVTSDQQAQADRFATATELEVHGDAIVVSTPRGKQSGKYKVKAEDKATLTILTDGDGPNDPQTFVFLDDQTLKWLVLEGKTIAFRKDPAP